MSATTVWINRSQPQTLQNACLLLYINAFIALVLGITSLQPLQLIAVLGAAGAYGIAQEKKWGYWLAAAVAIWNIALIVLEVLIYGARSLVSFNTFINVLFAAVLAYLLFHAHSRSYQRIWFKK